MTRDRQLVHKRNKLFSNNFMMCICCIQTVIDLCKSCILTTFNKDDDDDGGYDFSRLHCNGSSFPPYRRVVAIAFDSK